MLREYGLEQITGTVDGQVLAVVDKPLLTSASTPWSGFLLEDHSAHEVKSDLWWGWHRAHVSLVTSGCIAFRIRSGVSDEHFQARAGSILIFPSGFGETFFTKQFHFQLTCVELDPDRVSKCFWATRFRGLSPHFPVSDLQIASILTSMRAEVREDCPSGNLYGQHLSLALVSYLEARFSDGKMESREASPRLNNSDVKQLTDFIDENIGKQLSLFEMAKLVCLSPRQFSRVFCEIFGASPHQYLLRKKVDRAKELLAQELPLVEIADILGFASQSHFTQAFRKFAGTSPGRFRREHRSGLLGWGKRQSPKGFLAWNGRNGSNSDRTGQKGNALVAVLWSLLIVCVVVGLVFAGGPKGGGISKNLAENAAARAAADAGIERAILDLVAARSAPDILHADVRAYTWRFANRTVNITIQDEGGKIDLNQAPEPLLTALFTSAGVDSMTAQSLAAATADFRDKDSVPRTLGAEAIEYRAVGLAWGPKNAPFEAVEELQQVLGVTKEIYDQVAPYLTVYSVGGAINPNVATAPMTKLIQQVSLNSQNIASSAGIAYSIRAEVSALGGEKFVREAEIRLQNNRRLQIQSWEATSLPRSRGVSACWSLV